MLNYSPKMDTLLIWIARQTQQEEQRSMNSLRNIGSESSSERNALLMDADDSGSFSDDTLDDLFN